MEIRRASVKRSVFRYREGSVRERRDQLATEEPLEIRITRGPVCGPEEDAPSFAVTMRTPGDDFALAAGFLVGEGIVRERADIAGMAFCVGPGAVQNYNVLHLTLATHIDFDPELHRRNVYAASSCGVCGKASIEAVMGGVPPRLPDGPGVDPEGLLSMASALERSQDVFSRTGGLHAAARFDAHGTLVGAAEDVGRHNAMDKLVGRAYLDGELPLGSSVVVVTSRLSFELVQKAVRAGVPVLAGISAPSSLAVSFAEDAGLTLIGFLRPGRFNVYTRSDRVRFDATAAR